MLTVTMNGEVKRWCKIVNEGVVVSDVFSAVRLAFNSIAGSDTSLGSHAVFLTVALN